MSTSTEPVTWPLPAGRPARPHWWSIQPAPPGDPISARRAYLEVLAVFAAFFAAGIVAGGETFAGRYPPPSGSWAVFVPAALTELAMAGLAVAVTVLLSARRGVSAMSLGLGPPRSAGGGIAAGPSFRMAAWAILALVVGSVITGALAAGHLGQPAHQDDSYLLYSTSASLAAGVVEECVVLAFVVTTLRQAQRPLAEIVIVAIIARCSYHDYYGAGMIGIAVWAAVFAWLFLRTGSVLPLIVVHFFWDATIFWSQRWHWLVGWRLFGALLLIFGAVGSWLGGLRRQGGAAGQGHQPGALPGYTAWPDTQGTSPARESPAADPGPLQR